MLKSVRTAIAVLIVVGTAPFVSVGEAIAAPPELLSYQGVLLDAGGVAVTDGLYSLVFRMFPQESNGTSVFEQTLGVEVRKGLYNVILSNQGGYDLGDAVDQNSNLFIEVTILANGINVLSDVTLTPRQQLASVPYALSAPTPPAAPTPPVGSFVPINGIILWDQSTACPPGYQEVTAFAGRFPIGADTPGLDSEIDDGVNVPGGVSGSTSPWHSEKSLADRPKGTSNQQASDDQHEHRFVPPHLTVLFCQRT